MQDIDLKIYVYVHEGPMGKKFLDKFTTWDYLETYHENSHTKKPRKKGIYEKPKITADISKIFSILA